MANGIGVAVAAIQSIWPIDQAISHVYTPAWTRLAQNINADDPVVIPSIHECISLHLAGLLDSQTFQFGLLASGADVTGKNSFWRSQERQGLWKGVIEGTKSVPPAAAAYGLWTRGLISEEATREILKRNLCKRELWDATINQFRTWFSPSELFLLRNREYVSPEEYEDLLLAATGQTTRNMRLYDKLRFLIPPPSDLIRMGVKEAFDLKVVRDLQYNSPAPPEYHEWMKKIGYGGDGPEIADPNGGIFKARWSDLYWWMHWAAVPRTQGYEFLHRVRGDPNNPATWRVPGVKPFTSDDMDRLLRVADFPPFYNPYFQATSYRVLGTRELRWGLQYKIIPENELYEQFLDQGYNARDARFNVEIEKARLKDEARHKYVNGLVHALLSAYETGSIDTNVVANELTALELEPEEIDARISTVDIRVSTRLANEAIRAVRSSFFLGVVGPAETVDILRRSGIAETRATQYVAEWRSRLTYPRKQLATSKILSFYRERIISRNEAITRLKNLGWDDPELMLQVLSTERDIEMDLLREQARLQREEEKRLRAQERLLAKMQADRRRAISEMERYFNVGNLKRWYKLGLLSIDEVRAMLGRLEWTAEAIELLVAELLAGGQNE